jgi:hypothetical protein
MIKKFFHDVSIGSIENLTSILNPSATQSDLIMNFLRAMLNYSMVQKSMGKPYEEIFALILNHAKIVDEKVLLARMD